MSIRKVGNIKQLRLRPKDREELGVIVSFSDGQQKHFQGKDYLKKVAEFADQREITITCMSTPETIYRDLQGTRSSIDGRNGTEQYLPEKRFLSTIGRGDLFEI